ncbi:MAG TPA: enoyl-CoA hydratase-related protein [Gaiellaceae bacterium]|jgi:enoyl-CoA hydratase
MFVEEIADGVATLTLNRPEARNALPLAGWVELHERLERLGADDAVRVVVLTGTGVAFCSGDDIKEVAQLLARDAAWEVRKITLAIQQVTRDLVAMPKPAIAAVNGWALGAGFELALACDFAYAAESARFGFPETSIGMTITGGTTQLITRLCTLAQAKELAFTARKFTAQDALDLGLVNRVVPDAELLDAVGVVAAEIVRNSPVAVGLQKSGFNVAAESTLEHALEHETAVVYTALASEDGREGARAFAEKRAPVWPRPAARG